MQMHIFAFIWPLLFWEGAPIIMIAWNNSNSSAKFKYTLFGLRVSEM